MFFSILQHCSFQSTNIDAGARQSMASQSVQSVEYPNIANLGTPENCVADFCLIPVNSYLIFFFSFFFPQLRVHEFRFQV